MDTYLDHLHDLLNRWIKTRHLYVIDKESNCGYDAAMSIWEGQRCQQKAQNVWRERERERAIHCRRSKFLDSRHNYTCKLHKKRLPSCAFLREANCQARVHCQQGVYTYLYMYMMYMYIY